MDAEFNRLVNGVEANLKESKEQRLVMARNKLVRVITGLRSFEWGRKEYPNIGGDMTLEDFEVFLKKEKERLEKEIMNNGGKP